MMLTMILLVYGFGCFWYWYVGMVDNEEYSDRDFITEKELDDKDLDT
jgi:hypothetical protein